MPKGEQELTEKIACSIYTIVSTEVAILVKHLSQLPSPRDWDDLPDSPNKEYWRGKADQILSNILILVMEQLIELLIKLVSLKDPHTGRMIQCKDIDEEVLKQLCGLFGQPVSKEAIQLLYRRQRVSANEV